MWLSITFPSHFKCNLNMCLQCDWQSQLNCGGKCFFNVPALCTGGYMLGTWLIFKYILNVRLVFRYIQGVLENKPCTQHAPTCPQCKPIERTSVNHNSTVIGNHIAGTCWGYISNVKEMLLTVTLEANVEVTCEMWMECIWSEHQKNFLPKLCNVPNM